MASAMVASSETIGSVTYALAFRPGISPISIHLPAEDRRIYGKKEQFLQFHGYPVYGLVLKISHKIRTNLRASELRCASTYKRVEP